MEHIYTTKQKLLFEIEQLSNPYLMELQNFIQYLKFKQSSTIANSNDRHVLRPEEDPILRAFGLIDVPPYSVWRLDQRPRAIPTANAWPPAGPIPTEIAKLQFGEFTFSELAALMNDKEQMQIPVQEPCFCRPRLSGPLARAEGEKYQPPNP